MRIDSKRVAMGRRAGVTLGYPFDRGDAAMETSIDFSYDGVMRSVDDSLARLRLDRVDILYIHEPDDHYEAALAGASRPSTAFGATAPIGAVGVGMNQTKMLGALRREAQVDCFLVGGRYTLLDQDALGELFPECQRRGISIIAGGVYNSGILADPRPGAKFDYGRAPKPLIERAQRTPRGCARHDVPLMAAAIQFPLAHPVVAAVLTGVRTVEELDQNLAMFGTQIPDALWGDLRSEGLLAPDAPFPSLPRAVA